MQKTLSDLVSIPKVELQRLVEREPLLKTTDGEPHFLAQSLSGFEQMVRRLREFEAVVRQRKSRQGQLALLRSNRVASVKAAAFPATAIAPRR